MAIENNIPSTTHPTEYDAQTAGMKQTRTQRQKFIQRVKATAGDGFCDKQDVRDVELIIHVFAALLDSYHFGSGSKCNLVVEWQGHSTVLRYSHNRCPGLFTLSLEQLTHSNHLLYVVKHSDSDRGINTTYLTNPQRSLYEALFYFMLIFESKHPDKDPSELSHEPRFTCMSRQFCTDAV